MLLAIALNFNPRHPYGWRRCCRKPLFRSNDISIHATHTGGDGKYRQISVPVSISIHATHTGGDGVQFVVFVDYDISIHATHTGGAQQQAAAAIGNIFQSTPPIRVATVELSFKAA